MKSLLVICLALTGCASMPNLQYGGTRAGVQTISTVRHLRADQSSVSAYAISFLNIGQVSFNVQGIFPLDGSEPLVKFGVDVPVPLERLFK